MGQRLPALQPAEMVRALEKAGFYAVRHTGSHVIMYKEGLHRPVPVPIHSGELKRRLQSRIIKQAGLTTEEFSTLLQD
jgi:predicted RNA binding protein YcfA (HicA-like mRNA interferase family)